MVDLVGVKDAYLSAAGAADDWEVNLLCFGAAWRRLAASSAAASAPPCALRSASALGAAAQRQKQQLRGWHTGARASRPAARSLSSRLTTQLRTNMALN